MPPVEVILVESPDPNSPYGIKGVGEIGLVPTAGAVAAAMWARDGAWRNELPLVNEANREGSEVALHVDPLISEPPRDDVVLAVGLPLDCDGETAAPETDPVGLGHRGPVGALLEGESPPGPRHLGVSDRPGESMRGFALHDGRRRLPFAEVLVPVASEEAGADRGALGTVEPLGAEKLP
jgi:hypothetical protein